MYLSLNGHSTVPPGFRFHPTEEELLDYYLRKKVSSQKIDLDVIRDIDLNKLEPWDIQETCKIGSTPQNDWYFFSHKDKKYPTGTRTNRATAAGFWKATGRDKAIHSSTRRIGMRKTLVFYTGRAPKGLKSDWIMHEYRLDLDSDHNDEGWVVCRVFKKKNYQKSASQTLVNLSTTSNSIPRNDFALDQMLLYMERSSPSCKHENESDDIHLLSTLPSTPDSMHLPGLDGPALMKSSSSLTVDDLLISEIGPSSDWTEVDRLVASQINGQPTDPFPGFSFCFDQQSDVDLMIDSDYKVVPCFDHVSNSDNAEHLWEFGQPSSSTYDPLCGLSV